MGILITFIIIWALSPGPVAVMTLHESRKSGLISGIAVSTGASLTAALMVIIALLIHIVGFTAILDSEGMIVIEQIGAIGIISMGLYAGYKSLWSTSNAIAKTSASTSNSLSFIQGMLVFATYIPQSLVFYNVILPQTVEP